MDELDTESLKGLVDGDRRSIVYLIHSFRDVVSRCTEGELDADDAELLRELLKLCLYELLPAVHKFLNLPSPTSKSAEDIDLTKVKRYDKMVGPMKIYLTNYLKLLDSTNNTGLVTKMLRHTLYLIPFIIQKPVLAKNLLKKSITFWSEGDEKQCVLAFLIILRILRSQDDAYFGFVMKKLLAAYAKGCKKASERNWSMIIFMQQSLVELYSLNQAIAYQHAFLFIRNCAKILRDAMDVNQKPAFDKVYSFGFLNILLLWGRMLTSLHPSDVLQPLIHPLVQVSLGSVKLVPIKRYFPFRFHIARMLIRLSNKTGTHIPILPLLTEPLEEISKIKKIKFGGEDAVKDFYCTCKVTKETVETEAFVKQSIKNIYDLMVIYLGEQSSSIAFPELVFHTKIHMRKFLKETYQRKHLIDKSQKLKQLLTKIEDNCQHIESLRKNVSFALKDDDEVNNWQIQRKIEGTPLSRLYEEWQVEADNESRNRKLQKSLRGEKQSKRLKVSDSAKSRKNGSKYDDDEDEEEEDIAQYFSKGGDKEGSDDEENGNLSNDDEDGDEAAFDDDDEDEDDEDDEDDESEDD